MGIRNLDPEGRPIASILWELPEAVQVLDGARESELAPPLEGGDSVAVVLDLRARTGATERVSLKGMLVSRAVYGSPLPAVELELLPVPGASAAFSGGNALKGSTSELQFTWRNDSHASIPVREFRAPIPDSFRDISIMDGSGEAVRAEVESNPSEQAVSLGWPAAWPHLVVRPESGELAPGGRVRVTLVLRPTRSGLFACESAFYPDAGGGFVPLSGEVAVRVVEEEPRGKQAGGAKPEAGTDLEAVQGALQAQVRRELADFPLAAGSRIDLEAAKKDDRNWIAEDVLTSELIRKGYRVAVDSADEGGDSGASLSYRVVDARVVYMQKGWNPLAPKRRREAIGDLFLAFENTGRELSWIRRIQGYGVENVPSEGTRWLGGSETVDRVTVETGNKAVEVGISALIVGGLFFVFFVP